MTWRNLGDAVLPSETASIVDASNAEPIILTLAEFDRAVQALATQLRAEFAPGTSIGILGENSLRWAVAMYAVMRADLVAVPISYRQPADVIGYVIENADMAAIYTASGYRDLLATNPSLARDLDAIELHPSGEVDAPYDRSDFDPETPAMILYTSGSTGKPKGVVLSHRSHLWVVGLGIESTTNDSRLLLSAPLYHMGALSPLQRGLGAGQSVVLLPRYDGPRMLHAIETHRVTALNAVPPMAAMLLSEPDFPKTDVSSIREVILNSAPASTELLEELDRVFNTPRFVFTYGTTESSPIAFTAPKDGSKVPFGSLGVPHPAVEIRLVGENGEETPDHGILEIRSPGLMSGYHRRPDVKSPMTDDGYYHTGDVFSRDANGYYYCLGREDDMFNCGGENIYPRAVELALETHPAVSQAAVVPVVDKVKGFKPVAFVTLLTGREATEKELQEHSLTQLEPNSHPRKIWFVDSLPLNASNKLDKRSLTDRAAELVAE